MLYSVLVGIGVATLGLITLLVLIPVGIVSPANVEVIALAPEFWPIIVASVFTLMGVIIAVRSVMRLQLESKRSLQWQQATPRLIFVFAILFGYYFVIPYLGMVLPAMILIAVLSWTAGERRWKMIVLLSLITPIVLFSFFLFVANVPMPLGLFQFILG